MARLDTHFLRWQLFLAAAHFAAAIYVFVRVNERGSWDVPVLLRFNIWESRNGTCDIDEGCSINEYQRTLDGTFQTGWLVPWFSVVSGSHHLLAAMLGRSYLKLLLKNKGVAVLRHADYLISAPLMYTLDSVLWKAPPTLAQLVFAWAAMFLVILAGYGSEVAWSERQYGHAMSIFFLAVVPFIATFSVSWVVFTESLDPGSSTERVRSIYLDSQQLGQSTPPGSDPPEFVKVILGWIFTTYALFPFAALYRLLVEIPPDGDEYLLVDKISKNSVDDTPGRGAIFTESIYSALSLFSKIPLLVVYASAVLARQDRVAVEGEEVPVPGADADATFMALGISAGVSFVLGFVMIGDLYRCI